jgi:hypothetical protein
VDFAPAHSRGGTIGLALLGAVLALALVLLAVARASGSGPRAAVALLAVVALVPVALALGYRVWALYRLRYGLSRDSVVIDWLGGRQVVPMASITHLLTGRPYRAPLSGVQWPGFQVGRTVVALGDEPEAEEREALVYATVPPDGQLVVVTPALAYAISPADRAAFVEEFKVRRRLGSVQHVEQETVRPRWARLSAWGDGPLLQLLAVTVAANAVAFAWLLWRYPSLPAELALQFRFDAATQAPVPGPVRPLAAAWSLPLIGLGALALNTILAAAVHPRARLAALMLVAGALLVQVGILVVVSRLGSA